MAKQEFTREQVLDALQTHKTVQKAAKALGISYPKMQHYLKKYGIVCNHKLKEYVGPTEEAKVSVFSRIAYKLGFKKEGGKA